MSLPEINFRKIRLHKGSQFDAFEELCCQLASLETRPEDSRHYRKGSGRDAGVECYTHFADGTETGWQVKYYWDIDSLKKELNKSLASALKNHPNLTNYIVCIPFDPSESGGGKKTPLVKWQDWVCQQEKAANNIGRVLRIELWGFSELHKRLTSDDVRYAGRIQYWFGLAQMSSEWFSEKLTFARAGLGARYIEENNIELGIRNDLLALSRDPILNKTVEEWRCQLVAKAQRAISSVESLCRQTVALKGPEDLEKSFQKMDAALAVAPIDAASPFPIESWLEAAKKVRKEIYSHQRNSWSPRVEDIAPSECERCARDLRELEYLLGDIARILEDSPWRWVNRYEILLHGEGGIGKSHLLADTAKNQIDHDRPALLFLGEKFEKGEPIGQMMEELDLPSTYQRKHFLAALDAAGQAAGVRTLIMIDALNERDGIDIWPSRLAGMLKEIELYPYIAVVLSCRTPWLEHIIPDQLDETKLPRLKHYGFAERGGEAAIRYLKLRSMTRPGAPSMYPEFNNPLFLKTVCDALEKEGSRTFPKGLHGVTSIFKFYIKIISQQIERTLKLDPGRRIPAAAIASLAGAMADQSREAIVQSDVDSMFDPLLDSQGTFERSLLFQLESEGVVYRNPLKLDDGNIEFEVRFTFQRFSDYFIANKILDTHLDPSNPAAQFGDDSFLLDYVTGDNVWHHLGVIEAMAVRLPERFGVELLDLIPEGTGRTNELKHAFQESLLWRAPQYFTGRTFKLVTETFDDDDVTNMLISIATEPGNLYNAKFLHDTLAKKIMPDRDAFWSAHVAAAGQDEYSPINTLIDWAWFQGFEEIEDDRAELATNALTWMLSTTNRTVRDRATKALTSLLSPRLYLAPGLIEKFADIDDYYVLERLLAAIYGALMQGMTDDAIVSQVTQSVYDSIFANGNPPVNVLVRDNARGIHEYAAHRECLPTGIDMEDVRPPYHSPWPIEYVPDELIESYTQEYENGHVGRDAIVGSTLNDGDFARYVLDYHVNNWSPAPIGTDLLPTERDILEAWIAEFNASASKDAKLAYDGVQKALLDVKSQSMYAETPERKALEAAEQNFRKKIGDVAWEDYRVRAQGMLRDEPPPSPRKIKFGDGKVFEAPVDLDPPRHSAHFKTLWARRWVCKRAHDLGWSADLHGNFDRYSMRYSANRNDHKMERIGKKYQWLALYELRARMADNLAFINRYSDSAERYEGEWDDSLRDCDPSLLIEQTQNDGSHQNVEAVWWMPVAPQLETSPAQDRIDWMKGDSDIIDGTGLLTVHDPDEKRNWLTMWGFGHWSRKNESDDAFYGMERETWGRIQCLVVRKVDEAKLLDRLKKQRLVDPHSFSRYEFQSTNYIGEYPWHLSFDDYMDWEEPGEHTVHPVPIRQTTSNYTCEKAGYDHSIVQTISVRLPAPWMINAIGLELSNGCDLTYIDDSGHVRFFDPSVATQGPQAGLVDKDAFITMLEREELSAVWVVGGEKSAYGRHNGYGGRRIFTSLYRLENEDVVQFDSYVEFQNPSEEQLKKFLAEN